MTTRPYKFGDGNEQCGVAALAEREISDFSTISVTEIFDDETFECLFCPQDLLKIEFYQKIGFLFGNMCDIFSKYLSVQYTINIPVFVYSFLVCEEKKLRGGCGFEKIDALYERFKLYINPMFLEPLDEDKLTFRRVMNIANHEVCHVFLHCVDPIKYNIKNNYHGPEFYQIFSDIDEYFFDNSSLMKALWY